MIVSRPRHLLTNKTVSLFGRFTPRTKNFTATAAAFTSGGKDDVHKWREMSSYKWFLPIQTRWKVGALDID